LTERVLVAKERAKAEKLKKYNEKKTKTQTKPAASKPKEAKKPETKEQPLPDYVEETLPGEKKILRPLDDPFCKAYIPKVVESAWMEWWQKEKFFEPKFAPDGNVSKEGYFVIPIPPPNVTVSYNIT
jgi:valyl-tRNA synthetase